MARRALLVVVLLLAGCAPPASRPRPAPPPRPAHTGASEVERETARLRAAARERRQEQVARIERVGKRLLSKIPNAPRIQFLLIEGDPSINAGATFGQVGVTEGMLGFLEDDDEMAAVLGHEIAHITEGHVTRGLIGGIALTALAIAVESAAPGLGQTAGNVGQLFLNHYTQTQEREADRVGTAYAYRAGYDPRAAARVMERLSIEVPASMSSGFFSSHPSSVERMVTARKHAQDLLAQGPPPGREEAIAIRPFRTDVVPDPEAAEPERRIGSTPGPPPCARAEVYRRMAADAREPAERERYLDRARQACPPPEGRRQE